MPDICSRTLTAEGYTAKVSIRESGYFSEMSQTDVCEVKVSLRVEMPILNEAFPIAKPGAEPPALEFVLERNDPPRSNYDAPHLSFSFRDKAPDAGIPGVEHRLICAFSQPGAPRIDDDMYATVSPALKSMPRSCRVKLDQFQSATALTSLAVRIESTGVVVYRSDVRLALPPGLAERSSKAADEIIEAYVKRTCISPDRGTPFGCKNGI